MSENEEQLLSQEKQNDESIASSLKDNSYISQQSNKDHTNDNIIGDNSLYGKPSTNISNSISKIKDNINDNQPLSEFGVQHNFIYNKKSKVISFKDETQFTLNTFKRKKFAIAKNNLVTTFLIRNEYFSQFSNPKLIEKDKRVNVYIFEKDDNNDCYTCDDINEFISNLGIENITNELNKNLTLFIEKINDIFLNKNYVHIKRNNSIWAIICVFLLLCCIAFLGLLSRSLYECVHEYDQIINLSQTILIILIVVVSAIICFIMFYLTGLPMLFKFNKMNYLLKMYKDNANLINSWNKSIFESNHIKVSIPVSLDYIVFNKDPSQDIQITHINLDHIKRKFNPGFTVEPIVFTDDKMEGMFEKENL